MANELNLILDPVLQTGLTVDAKVRQANGTQMGATVTCTEPQTGYYTGTYNLGTLADGIYSVDFTDNSSGRLLGTGELDILSGAERVNPSLAEVRAEVDAALVAYDGPTLAEMTAAFTEIKGPTWTTTDTLEAIRDAVGAGGSGLTAAQVWAYATRTLTAGTKDSEIDGIKAVTDTMPTNLTAKLQVIRDISSDSSLYIPNETPLP
jgi:hypothetical protein